MLLHVTVTVSHARSPMAETREPSEASLGRRRDSRSQSGSRVTFSLPHHARWRRRRPYALRRFTRSDSHTLCEQSARTYARYLSGPFYNHPGQPASSASSLVCSHRSPSLPRLIHFAFYAPYPHNTYTLYNIHHPLSPMESGNNSCHHRRLLLQPLASLSTFIHSNTYSRRTWCIDQVCMVGVRSTMSTTPPTSPFFCPFPIPLPSACALQLRSHPSCPAASHRGWGRCLLSVTACHQSQFPSAFAPPRSSVMILLQEFSVCQLAHLWLIC
jgi:hypothetical protein